MLRFAWQAPVVPTLPPPTPTKLFGELVLCPFYERCHTSWKTPVRHCLPEDDVEYSEYRLRSNLLNRLQRHFRGFHNHIRGKIQVNITINSSGDNFVLSKGMVGECPTCKEVLFRPNEEEKLDPYICTAMGKSISDHRLANEACRDLFCSLYSDEDLKNVVPKTFIWGLRHWIPVQDETGLSIEPETAEARFPDDDSEFTNGDSRENSLRAHPSKIDDNLVLRPAPVDFMTLEPSRAQKVKNSQKNKPRPKSAIISQPSRETTLSDSCETSLAPDTTIDENSIALASPLARMESDYFSPQADDEPCVPREFVQISRMPTHQQLLLPFCPLSHKKALRKPIYAMSCRDVSVPTATRHPTLEFEIAIARYVTHSRYSSFSRPKVTKPQAAKSVVVKNGSASRFPLQALPNAENCSLSHIHGE